MSAHQSTQHNFSLGAAGEAVAAQHLISLGYTVLDINIRLRQSEIDIIALDTDKQELVFVEVKTRSSAAFGDPSLAVTRKKLISLARVAKAYCRQQHLELDYRFDTIAVLPGKIEHFQNITWGMF